MMRVSLPDATIGSAINQRSLLDVLLAATRYFKLSLDEHARSVMNPETFC
jgi:hypothetical protein